MVGKKVWVRIFGVENSKFLFPNGNRKEERKTQTTWEDWGEIFPSILDPRATGKKISEEFVVELLASR